MKRRHTITLEQQLWFLNRVGFPAGKDLAGGTPLPNVLLWVYLQGMYDAMRPVDGRESGMEGPKSRSLPNAAAATLVTNDGGKTKPTPQDGTA